MKLILSEVILINLKKVQTMLLHDLKLFATRCELDKAVRYNSAQDLMATRQFIKHCDNETKNAFKTIIPDCAKISSRSADSTKLEKKLMSYL